MSPRIKIRTDTPSPYPTPDPKDSNSHYLPVTPEAEVFTRAVVQRPAPVATRVGPASLRSNMPGEFELIDWIKSLQKPSDFVKLAAGDDLAVLDARAGLKSLEKGQGRVTADLLLVGVDQVLEGRHFDLAKHAPRDIGRKAMNRNLSDCGAMGCLPAAAVVTVALPNDFGIDRAKELYLGLKEAGDKYYCPIVGGDTASWAGPLAVTVTILGRSMGVDPVTRGGAQVGDGIYVTGPLGGSILGRHLTFEPRVALGRQLATYRPTGLPVIKAMIDVSDGLSRDLRHLLAPSATHPRLGARLDPALIPIHPDAVELAGTSGKPPLYHALHDGEDHELLFTCPVRPPHGFRIGTITADPAVLLGDTPLETLGWEHKL